MATSNERSMTTKINIWVQTIGIMMAACWGVYTFVYKEIIVPKAAPINITVDLQLKKTGMRNCEAGPDKNPLVAVEMRIAATNPSSRVVYLLPSAWIAYGVRVNAISDNPKFPKKVISLPIFAKEGAFQFEKYTTSSNLEAVAMGSLLDDNWLKPNETSKRTLVFHVPRGIYDHIELGAVIPTVGKSNGADLEWNFDHESHTLFYTMYQVSESGERSIIQEAKASGYEQKLEFQLAFSRQALSLWEY